MSQYITVLIPRALHGKSRQETSLAPRPNDLNGAVLGFLNNSKHHVDTVFQVLERRITDTYYVKGTSHASKVTLSQPAPAEALQKLGREATVVINGIAD